MNKTDTQHIILNKSNLDFLDDINLDLDHIESLNGLTNEITESLNDITLANQYYALSHSIDFLLQDINLKLERLYTLLSEETYNTTND